MELRKLNPKVYEMWALRKEAGVDYFENSLPSDIDAIEVETGSALPKDYKDFLLKYSMVAAVPKIGAYYFRCTYPDRDVITFDFSLIPAASSTLSAVRALHNPHPHFADVGVRIPRIFLPLTLSNDSTLLIDLRPKEFGRILYIRDMKKQTFGVEGYGWKNVGFVAENFTAFLKDLDTEDEQVKKYSLPVCS